MKAFARKCSELTSDMSWLSNLHIHDEALLVTLLVGDGNADDFAKKIFWLI